MEQFDFEVRSFKELSTTDKIFILHRIATETHFKRSELMLLNHFQERNCFITLNCGANENAAA